VNEQLQLSETAATVQHNVSTGISTAWAKASAAASQAAERTKEFEAKHKLRDRTLMATFRGMNFVNTSFNKLCGNPDFTESPTGPARARGFNAAAEGEAEDNPLMQEPPPYEAVVLPLMQEPPPYEAEDNPLMQEPPPCEAVVLPLMQEPPSAAPLHAPEAF
jgi:hypothetical protein